MSPSPSDRRRRRRRRGRASEPNRDGVDGRERPRHARRALASPAPPAWSHPRRLMPAAATVLILGLGLVGLGPSILGAGLTLLGAAAFLYAIHRYGRLGPDDGSEPV